MKKTLLWIAIIIGVIALIAAFLYIFYLTRNIDDTETVSPETVQRQSATLESETTTETTAITEVLNDETLGVQLRHPSDWTISQEPSINPSAISHSGISVVGLEGKVTVLNTTGLGSGPCSSRGYEQIDLKLTAGVQSVCHWIEADGVERWQTGSNVGTKNNFVDNDLVVDGGEMAVFVDATANAPYQENRELVLSILESLNFIPIK